ncbi:outer membrane efflux protein [Leptospira ryugenii]|uniref:Outer membrane efflux protein n=1 Tax=Leptospira ryugenii TaxID=1917863 RepID=A0A2P2E0C4_9LEPT|nr:TolC family protein [Leptospira ryugenii]GBF50329.1 outer membrane efflux protein [Leptospira ryugenii]
MGSFLPKYLFYYKQCILFYIILFTSALFAEENIRTRCSEEKQLTSLSKCLVQELPEFKMEELKLGEMRGRKKIASYLFPQNPLFNQYLAQRQGNSTSLIGNAPTSAQNFQVMVSQEIYTNGKREIAMQIADEEFQSQVLRLETTRRLYEFEVLKKLYRFRTIHEEERNLFETLSLTQDIKKIAKARIKEGLSPGIDEALTEAEEIRVYRLWAQSKRLLESTKSELELLLKLDLTRDWIHQKDWILQNETFANKSELVQMAIMLRPELKLTENEIQIANLEWNRTKKEKIPNVSLGAFAQNDGFNERVIGGLVSFPILVWRDFEGELLVTKTKVQVSKEKYQLTERSIKQEVLQAVANYSILNEEIKLYESEKMIRAENDIKNLQEAVRFGRVRLLEAIQQQRILLQTKLLYLNAKLEWELATIELTRVLGLPIEQLEAKK